LMYLVTQLGSGMPRWNGMAWSLIMRVSCKVSNMWWDFQAILVGAEQLRICNDDDGARYVSCLWVENGLEERSQQEPKNIWNEPPPMHNTNLADTSIANNLELALEGWFAHFIRSCQNILIFYFLFNAHYSSQTFTPEGIFSSPTHRLANFWEGSFGTWTFLWQK
jgi:hypothetical protein